MQISRFLAAAGLLQASAAAVLPRQAADATTLIATDTEAGLSKSCPKVQLIVARGTHQKPGLGSMKPLTDLILKQVPGSRAIALAYPASLEPTYQDSVGTGDNHMTKYIEYFATRCPQAKLVVMGYSQGAQVTMDALCGNTEDKGFDQTSALPAQYRDNVHAVVVWGDPSRTAGEPYDKGTATGNGKFPRSKKSCAYWAGANKVRSYCDVGDPYCALGNEPSVHGSYGGLYKDASAAFVERRVK